MKPFLALNFLEQVWEKTAPCRYVQNNEFLNKRLKLKNLQTKVTLT